MPLPGAAAITEPPAREAESRLRGRRRVLERFALHVALPLLLGGACYLLWRPQTLLMFDWAHALGAAGAVGAVRAHVGAPPAAVPDWVIYSLPNMLWLYAFTWQLGLIWGGKIGRGARVWLSVPAAVGIGAELGQAVGLVPGTFGWVDLFTCVLAAGIALVLVGRTFSQSRGNDE